MPRTLMPTPNDPEPNGPARPSPDHRDLDDQALLDFLRGDYPPASAIASPASVAPVCRTPSTSEESRKSDANGDAGLSYLPVASSCFAVIQYDATTARLVRRVVGMFGDPHDAERYGQENGYRLYDVVPATSVVAGPATAP